MSEPARAARPAADRLTPELRAYLAGIRWATIATVDPDGAPHEAVIWYGLQDDGLIINSRRTRHWPRNLLRDPRITMAGLKGEARLLHEGAQAIADIQALARRYDRDPSRYEGQDRLTFLVEVEQTFEYRG